MDNCPFFIEAPMPGEEHLAVCAKIHNLLVEGGMEAMPQAASAEDAFKLKEVLESNGARASVFVVNTYLAKDIIPELDELMGETPVLFLRRGLYAGRSGLNKHVQTDPTVGSTEVMIGKMQLRLTSIWYYGKNNVDDVASRASQSITRFLEDGSFRHVEIAANG